MFNSLKSRGVKDCFIACMDGLKGLPEAVEAVFPRAQVQLAHRASSAQQRSVQVPAKNRRAVAADLRSIYTAPTETAAKDALGAFAAKWDGKYPAIAPTWANQLGALDAVL